MANRSKTRKAKVRVRKIWGIHPGGRVIPDKTKRPFRKRKHKKRNGDDE